MFLTTTAPDYWQFIAAPSVFDWSSPLGIGVALLLIGGLVSIIGAIVFRVVLARKRKTNRDVLVGWIVGFGIVCLVVSGILALINAGFGSSGVSSDGATKPESLQSWMQTTYDIEISENGAQKLINRTSYEGRWKPDPAVVSYGGEYVKVSLLKVDVAESAYILVKDGTLEPLPVPVDK